MHQTNKLSVAGEKGEPTEKLAKPETIQFVKEPPFKALRRALDFLHTFWIVTESDFWTFVIPNTVFGISGALAGPVLTTNGTIDSAAILCRLPGVLLWNWLNLTIFDLANQRLPDSVAEDFLNKPWRAIPAGLLTPKQMRRALLAALPVVIATNYTLGAWQETALLFVLTWMYNDLRGGDEDFILRNLIISFAFALYNGGSLRLSSGANHSITAAGFYWIAMISAVIFTTMQIQDLKDVEGDRARNRLSAPIVLGDKVARWTIAIPIMAWSILCPFYLNISLPGYILPILLGTFIACRTISLAEPQADRKSWQLWAGWLLSLYTLPILKESCVFSGYSAILPI